MRIDFHMYFNKYVREINAHFIFQNLIKCIAIYQNIKQKAHCGGMNAVGFVELMVIETTTSSMRTKRSTN